MGITVLIVEDDDSTRMMHEKILHDEKIFEVFTAVDGSDALTKLESIPKPTVILTDLQMSPMSGREFIRRLKTDSRFQKISVIVISGETQTDDLLGKVAFILSKPVERKKLIWTIVTVAGWA